MAKKLITNYGLVTKTLNLDYNFKLVFKSTGKISVDWCTLFLGPVTHFKRRQIETDPFKIMYFPILKVIINLVSSSITTSSLIP